MRIVAPSGPFDEALFPQGLALVASKFRVVSRPAPRRDGFLAGSDDERLRELQEALDDPSLDCIWVARGGYGISRILPRLRWKQFTQRPKWIVGFSDVTTLHLAVLAQGFACVHGPNITTLGQHGTEFEELCALLGEPDPVPTLSASWLAGPHESLSAEVETAPVYGGNLTVLFAEAAAGRLAVPDGCALLLEDVTETSYRVERMLVALQAGGHFGRVSALLLGDFHDCSPGKFGVSIEQVLSDAALSWAPLIVRDLPVGHGARNRPVILGRKVRLVQSR